MKPDLEHLRDHVQLFLTAIAARAQVAGSDDNDLRAIAEQCQERVLVRELGDPNLTSTIAFDRLGLSQSERQVLWMLAALMMSQEARTLLGRVLGDTDCTLHAIRVVVYGSAPSSVALRELSPSGSLRRLGLIERTDGSSATHESRQTWGLASRVLDLLHGELDLDRTLGFIDAASAAPAQLALSDDIETRIARAIAEKGIVVVAGTPGLGRRTVLVAGARAAGLEPLVIDARRLATDVAIAGELRAIVRECKLLGLVPVISNLDALDGERLALVGSELVAQLDGPILAISGVSRPTLRWDRPTIVIEMEKPGSEALGKLWLRELGQGDDRDAEGLAARYPLAPALIHHAAKAAKARAACGELTAADITAGVRTVLDDKLGQLARRVTVTQTWNDIVLPSDQLEAVSELISRVRGRRRVFEEWGFGAKVGKGLGVSALFSGPPGTGKTMLAALIARELRLELYQVDLGKVVSKWIGETEKNLGALFDAAEAGHAILLFDEADALFGKRTDVKSSNDRHANLETNYLLQRLESYTGICLLTTNHDSHIDQAFQRRLALHLRLELPDAAERADLWRAMLPAAAPVADDLDVHSLARRFAMSGGYIRNAVLRAAFVAADRNIPITAEALERAARREYEGMGKIVAA
jgi:ATP-dependent 26S proteasome regulatory subunit